MKTTLRKDLNFQAFVSTFQPNIQNEFNHLSRMIFELTTWKPNIWGNDIVGFGHITYSNTYLKDQPYFNIGIRKTTKGYTLYLNAYDQKLYEIADQYHIKYGVGCFYLKTQDIYKEGIKQLIQQNLTH
jgi:hypothetical protein